MDRELFHLWWNLLCLKENYVARLALSAAGTWNGDSLLALLLSRRRASLLEINLNCARREKSARRKRNKTHFWIKIDKQFYSENTRKINTRIMHWIALFIFVPTSAGVEQFLPFWGPKSESTEVDSETLLSQVTFRRLSQPALNRN